MGLETLKTLWKKANSTVKMFWTTSNLTKYFAKLENEAKVIKGMSRTSSDCCNLIGGSVLHLII
jgi:hypothetical protein